MAIYITVHDFFACGNLNEFQFTADDGLPASESLISHRCCETIPSSEMAGQEIDLTELDSTFLLQMYTKLKQVDDRGDIIQPPPPSPPPPPATDTHQHDSNAIPSTSAVPMSCNGHGASVTKPTFETIRCRRIDDMKEPSREACRLFSCYTGTQTMTVSQIADVLGVKAKEALEMLLDQVWNYRGKMPVPYEGFSFVPLMKEYLVGREELDTVRQAMMDSDPAQFGVREMLRQSSFLCPSALEIILALLYTETQDTPLYRHALEHVFQIEEGIEESQMDTDEIMEIFDETYESLRKEVEDEHVDIMAQLKELGKDMEVNTGTFDSLSRQLSDLSRKVEDSKKERIAKQLLQIQENEVEVMDDTEPIREIVPSKYRQNIGDLIVLKTVSKDSLDEVIRLPPLPTNKAEWPPLVVPETVWGVISDQVQNPKWIEATIEEVRLVMGENRFKIKYPVQRSGMGQAWVEREHLAFGMVPKWRLDEGVRIVAFYKDEANPHFHGWYSGTVGEKPATYNQERYLVFFDDGAVQYVKNELVRLLCSQRDHPRDSYLDLPETSAIKDFLMEYLQGYPDRLMIRVRRAGEKIRAERQGKWYMKKGEMGTVMAIDGSLIKVRFPTYPPVEEWLFRGSPRLWEIATSATSSARKAPTSAPQRTRVSRNLTQRRRVEMVNPATMNSQLQVARKSTALRQGSKFYDEEWSSEVSEEESEEDDLEFMTSIGRTSSIITRKTWNSEYTEHKLPPNLAQPRSVAHHKAGPCTPRCLLGSLEDWGIDYARGISPFVAPMVSGWARQLAEFDDKDPKKKFVYYVAPCGRRLRSIGEIVKYIKMTESTLPADYFTFEKLVQPLRLYRVLQAKYELADYSDGNENVPVSVVNTFSDEPPPLISYSADRYPWDGASEIPKICSGCDCLDDCGDPQKCACQRLTVEGVMCLTTDDRPPKHKRNYQKERRLGSYNGVGIKSGIYECNDMCSCRRGRCVNRVAQRKLMIPLQLFKTADKGWGIRTLVDIPKGQFICIYAGAILSDEGAETLGKQNEGGDEYFADMDLIAAVEGEKEGYESDSDEDLAPPHGGDEGRKDCITPDANVHFSLDNKEEDEKMDEGDTPTARKSGNRGTASPQNAMMPASAAPVQEEIASDRFTLTQYYGAQFLFVIDAKRCGNLGRYLNHSCEPNVFVQNVLVDSHDLRFPWVAFFALRTIKAGEELCWDYSYEVGPDTDAVYCKCGTRTCRKRLR